MRLDFGDFMKACSVVILWHRCLTKMFPYGVCIPPILASFDIETVPCCVNFFHPDITILVKTTEKVTHFHFINLNVIGYIY